MGNHLFSNILSTGSKFVITDKTTDSIFGPGTIGIMNYVKGADVACANVVYICVTILKRGKHGMSRLDTNVISTPIFKFEKMDSVSIMPDKKRKHYVYIEPKVPNFKTIYEMPSLEYLGWGLSWINYLNKLTNRTNSYFIWPTNNKSIINRMFNVASLWKNDPDHTIDRLCSAEARRTFVNKMRIMEATFTECSLHYMLKVSELEIHAARYLMKHNKNKIEVCDKNILDKTHGIFLNKYTNLSLLKKRSNPPLGKKLTSPF